MADRLILCSECGTKNRVGGDRAGRPTCGNCGKALAVPGYAGVGTWQSSRPFFWFALGAASVVGILYYNDPNFIRTFGAIEFFNTNQPLSQKVLSDEEAWGNQSSNKKAEAQLQDFSNESVEVDEVEVQVPPKLTPVAISTGVVMRAKNAVAPLKIITSEGYNYFVKLVDMKEQTVMTMYIVGGEPFETKAPLGTFEIRYVSGQIWYGEQKNRFFGKETSSNKAKNLSHFDREHEYYLELIMQQNGNFPVVSIPLDQF